MKDQGIFAFTLEEQKSGQADHYAINPVEVSESANAEIAVTLFRHSNETIASALSRSGFILLKAPEFLAFGYSAEDRDVYFKAHIARKG